MEDDTEASEYWCHVCSQIVNPILEVETVKCPICQSGFVEEMSSADASSDLTLGDFSDTTDDRALHLWAPILLGMLGSRRRRRRFRRLEFEMDDDDNEHENNPPREEEAEVDRELESLMRRTRNTAALVELLRDSGIASDSDRDGERVILLNSIYDSGGNPTQSRALPPIGSLGDCFVGPGLEVLLQHLADNDPNRYGTPPAKKEAVEALAMVEVEEAKQFCVCLDDLEIGAEAREMPCKHKFHGDCLLPWLELHSSCPVCRYQLPCDESKIGREEEEGSLTRNRDNAADDDGNDGRPFSLHMPAMAFL